MTTPYCGTVCTVCHEAPAPLPEQGSLFLFPSTPHTARKLKQALAAHRPEPEALSLPPGAIQVQLAPGAGPALVRELVNALSAVELRQTRALLKGGERALLLEDLPAVAPLQELAARIGAGWLADLLNRDGLISHFQPIVPIGAPDRAFAYEALLRGVDADGRLIPPLSMFDAARSASMLPQLDLAARRTALRLAAKHGLDATLFINLNPSAIVDPGFCVGSIMGAVDEAGLGRKQVVIEIVESDQASDAGQLVAVVQALQRRGFAIALDDFGAGYSSLTLLNRLRPDYLKLDRELVHGIDQDPYKAALVENILNFAHPLGIATIAEGVETRDEYAWFEARGARYAQGYWIARPAPPDELGW